jgi:dihydroflavonol-4-reductase
MRALVTGGTGFIGANLVAGLNQRAIGARVLHRPSSSLRALQGLTYESVTGDILDEPAALALAMDGCDWVFHVAAVSDYWRQDKAWLYRVNVQGTRNVLAAAQAAGVQRLVFTSSLAAMGVPAPGELLDESNAFNLSPDDFPYGHSKVLAEQEVSHAVANGLAAVVVNPSAVLGPRAVNQIYSAIVAEIAKGRMRLLPPGGTNFVDVADVVSGHIAAAESGRVGERYILGGVNLSFAEAVTAACEIMGREPPRLRLPRRLLPALAIAVRAARSVLGNRVFLDENQVRLMRYFIYADNSKALEELNLPQTPFASSVQRTYSWYNKNGYLS